MLSLLLLFDAVLLQKELVLHPELLVVPNLRPSTETIAVDTDKKHPILSGGPLAAIVGRFSSFWEAEIAEV